MRNRLCDVLGLVRKGVAYESEVSEGVQVK
jgi:hypothetical protein